MALINTGPDYTRTGDNFLTRWSNIASAIPIVGPIATGFLGFAGTAVDTVGWLLRGKIGSAATAAVTGTVSTAVNSSIAASGLWWVNATSGIVSGNTVGSHSRALTEGIVGSVTGALGMRPTVLRSYTAGVGSIGGGNTGPGYYATRAAQERGQDPSAMWNNYRNGSGADHVAALEASRAAGPNQRGV